MVECNLKYKNPLDASDLRFEGEEEGGGGRYKLEELVLFGENVYVMMSGREYVFKEGTFFSEDNERDLNVRDYALIAPSEKAPLNLRLTPRAF